MKPVLIYFAAALAEIVGCFAFWAWFRLDKSVLWLAPGMLSLAAFAWLLALSPAEQAGREYAVYGGIYIVSSLLWLWSVEGHRPDLSMSVQNCPKQSKFLSAPPRPSTFSGADNPQRSAVAPLWGGAGALSSKTFWLRRAVDQHDAVLGEVLFPRVNIQAAKRLPRKLIKRAPRTGRDLIAVAHLGCRAAAIKVSTGRWKTR